MSPERQPGQEGPIQPLPFALPEDFLARLGYHDDQRFVGLYWERAGDEVAFDDGMHSVVGADQYVFFELTRQPQVETWLWEQNINLGNSDELPTHWLLVDRATNQAYMSPLDSASETVKTQRVEDLHGTA